MARLVWPHDIDDLSFDDPRPATRVSWEMWRHLRKAHDYNPMHLSCLSEVSARARHLADHGFDPGRIATEPELRGPRWPWSRSR